MTLDDFESDTEDVSLPEAEYEVDAEDVQFPAIKPIKGGAIKHPVKHYSIGHLHYMEDTNEIAIVGRKIEEKHFISVYKGYAISVSVLEELPEIIQKLKTNGKVPKDAELTTYLACEVGSRDIYKYTMDQFKESDILLKWDDDQLCVPVSEVVDSWPDGMNSVLQVGGHQITA